MATKLEQRYGLSFADNSAKADIAWCESTANQLDTALLGMIERKILTRDGAYTKQLRSIINRVRAERMILSEELLDHMEGKEEPNSSRECMDMLNYAENSAGKMMDMVEKTPHLFDPISVSRVFAETRESFVPPEGSTLVSKNEGMEVYRTPDGAKIVNIG